jgi:acetoin utilization protein AcuB
MKVGRRLVKRDLVTVAPGDSLELAFQLMVSNRIRHLPVTERGRVKGILSDRDLKSALIQTRQSDPGRDVYYIPPGVTVSEIMTADPICITPADDIEEAARLMHRHRIGALPVVEEGLLVGILTESDILAIFIEIMGVIESSSRIDVEMDESADTLNVAAEIIRKQGARVISIAMSAPTADKRRVYYFRLSSTDTAPIVTALEQSGFKVTSSIT